MSKKIIGIVIAVAIVAALAVVGVALGVVTVSAAIFSVASTAITATIGALLAPTMKNFGPAPSAAPINGQRDVTIKQSLPPRRYVYGKCRVGGSMFFQDNDNPDLFAGLLLSDGVLQSIDAIYLGAANVPIDWTTGLASAGTQWAGKLEAERALGLSTQAASVMLTAAFPALVDSTFRQRGVARLVLKFDWGIDAAEHSVLWGAGISPSVGVLGVKMYDPRDAAQSPSSSATWTYSANPALCVAHALTNAWDAAIKHGDINWDTVASAANTCDTLVDVGVDGEQRPIFELAGIFQSGPSIAAQVVEMVTSFAGAVIYEDGLFSVYADRARNAVWTITDEDILEYSRIDYDADDAEIYNVIKAIYFNADDSGTPRTTQPYEVPGAVASEGRRETAIPLPYTPYEHSAKILAYRALLRLREGKALAIRTTDAGLYLSAFDVVVVNSTTFPQASGTYEVIQTDLAQVGAMLILRGYVAAAYDTAAVGPLLGSSRG